MTEYIEREADIDAVLDVFYDTTDIDLSGEKLEAAILNVQAADVEPVRHGQWIYDHWCEFRCSVCGEFSNSKPYRGKENYCPNCGAKMNEEAQNER